jgi:Tfp pilus assembly protein PilF
MVTSQSSIERVKLKQAIDSDVDNYLLKPFRVDDLKAKVDEVLKRAKKRVGLDSELARGAALLASGQWGQALKVFKQVVTKDPHSVQGFLGLATAQHHIAPEKAIPMATQYIRKALKINPSCVQGHIDLALTYESAMSLEKAIACLKEALELCVLSEQIHFHLGRLLIRRGNRAEGVKELRKALELKPDYREAAELLEGGTE